MSSITEVIPGLAETLWRARLEAKPCPAPTESFPELTTKDAYRLSRLNFERRLKETRALPVGKKIGLTSLAVQKQLNVDQPDFGYLTSDMAVAHGGVLAPGTLIQGKVEGEAAFILKGRLAGPGVTREQVVKATDCVQACIEVIDSRVKDWKIKIQDTIADNASSAFFVLGPDRRRLADVDLKAAAMTLKINGEMKSTGQGAACLGDPLLAVAWLANKLGEFGETLEPGEVILSGAYGPVVAFNAGDRCEVEISGLGDVSCSYGS